MATALNRMIKKAASSAIPLANRTIPHRKYTSAIFSTPLKTSTTINNSTTDVFVKVFPSTHHHFSALSDKISSTDDDFLSVIESEFDLNVEKFHEVLEAPREFPFKITKNPEETFIRLTREYEGEEILVAVYGPDYSHCYIRLDVRVSQKNGQTLVFDVKAETADDITITYFAVKNPNELQIRFPHDELFEELDENTQKYYYKYLEDRGIEPSIFKFLHDCMVQKERRKYAVWLMKLNNFIADTRSNTDETLLSLIESEIEEKLHEVPDTPRVLPFKIEDNAMEDTITLTREYQGEEIKVTVVPRYISGHIHHVCLAGCVSKKSGLALKFNVTPGSNGIEVNSFYVDYASDKDAIYSPTCPPCFSDLDQNLQKTYRTYLEARGIKPSIFKILCNYMIQRRPNKYVEWLTNLKNFIAY